MTYTADDTSVASSRPRELFTFETPSSARYLTSFTRDVIAPRWDDPFTNVTYVATPGFGRTSLPIVSVGGTTDVSVDLPFEHAVAQEIIGTVRFMKRFHKVTIVRQQEVSGETRRVWQGYVTSALVDGRKCSLKIPNLVMDAIDMEVPNAVVSRYCQNILYDDNCRVLLASYAFVTTVAGSPTGPVVSVAALSSFATDYYKNGMIVHNASSEKRTIVSNSSLVLTLDAPFPNDIWAGSTAVTVYPGCDHTIDGANGCYTKFANRVNFAGMPQLPVSNPYLLNLILSKPRV